MRAYRFLVAGGAGFIGCNFVRYLLRRYDEVEVLVYDKLTYAGRLENLHDVSKDPRFRFVRGDVCDERKFLEVLKEFEPDVIVNFAAETHVDRSINEPAPFLRTNVLGVFSTLEAVRRWGGDPIYLYVSTDEVYGDLWDVKDSASEDWPLRPSSPYSASKAAADLLVQAYRRTYSIKTLIVRPCNNYGPYQHPEKLIPRTIIRALHNMPIPLYGGGYQVRDWIFVEDCCEAIDTVIRRGKVGEIYNIPGFNEKRNIDVVRDVLKLLGKPETLIKIVEDRPGHDRRYSMRGNKILALGWRPKTPWLEGLRKTIEWYLSNRWWWEPLLSDDYFRKDVPWR